MAVAKVKLTDSELKEKLARAKTAIRPDVGAAFVISEFGGHLDVVALAVQLEIGMNDVRKNDFRECEAMLYSQAHALQAIFVDALLQVKNLVQIKNPPAVFARQANIAQGPQQVNNAMPAGEPLARGENKNTPNKTIGRETA